MRDFDLSPLFRSSVGFDHMARILDEALTSNESSGAYPPYNIERIADDHYRIVMAVAGFRQEDMNVVVQDNTLTISGKAGLLNDDKVEYLHRGIAGRAFERHFQLADFIKIGRAKLEHGLLAVDLVRELPEALKPRQIEIDAGEESGKLIEQK